MPDWAIAMQHIVNHPTLVDHWTLFVIIITICLQIENAQNKSFLENFAIAFEFITFCKRKSEYGIFKYVLKSNMFLMTRTFNCS